MKVTRGIGMVEILVTMFILSIGLLGVASLQLVGSFTNAEALSRTQAEFVAEQVTERLHAASAINSQAQGIVLDDEYFSADNYNFGNLSEGSCTSTEPFKCYCEEIPTSVVPDCESNECSASQIAIYDTWALSCAAVQANPQTQLSLSCSDTDTTDLYTCTPGSTIQVQLKWPLRAQQNDDVNSDTRCEQETGQAYACVTKVVVL